MNNSEKKFLFNLLSAPSPTGFETEGQKETYIKYRRGIVKGIMLDAFLDDNEKEAVNIMMPKLKTQGFSVNGSTEQTWFTSKSNSYKKFEKRVPGMNCLK